MTAAQLLLLVILQTATGKGDMGPTSGPHHGSFVNGMLDGGDGEYAVTEGGGDDGDFDITGDMGPTSGPHHGSFVNGMLDGGDGEYGVTEGGGDDGDFDITGYLGTTSGPHDGSFVNGMVDGGDQEYDDSDHDADVGVTERDDVGDAGLHRVPTSEFDITDLTKPVECRRMSISVRDQFQILKERRGLIARALHSRTAQNQSQLATFPTHGGRAVNARETAPGQFPYHTLVLADNRVLCGGALLSASVVLTAAQCVFQYKTWLVQLGSVELLVQNPHRQLIEGRRVKTHPLYSHKRTNDDIAVVFLRTSAVLNSYVKTVRLPTDMMKEDLVGRMGIVAGWGRTHVLSRCSQVLQYMPLVVDSDANCRAYFPNYNARTSFCAGGVYGASICNGDNGSPFTFGTTTGYVVIGVASFVFSEHCLTDFPAGFTRVTNYLTWISKTSGIKLT